jgi:hypothetical protein
MVNINNSLFYEFPLLVWWKMAWRWKMALVIEIEEDGGFKKVRRRKIGRRAILSF